MAADIQSVDRGSRRRRGRHRCLSLRQRAALWRRQHRLLPDSARLSAGRSVFHAQRICDRPDLQGGVQLRAAEELCDLHAQAGGAAVSRLYRHRPFICGENRSGIVRSGHAFDVFAVRYRRQPADDDRVGISHPAADRGVVGGERGNGLLFAAAAVDGGYAAARSAGVRHGGAGGAGWRLPRSVSAAAAPAGRSMWSMAIHSIRCCARSQGLPWAWRSSGLPACWTGCR